MGVRVLTPRDRALVESITARDPVRHVFIESRLDAGVLERGRAGELWGFPADAPRSLLHVGANIVPCLTDAAARMAVAERLGPRRSAVSIVGPRGEVLDLLEVLGERWGPEYSRTRALRYVQPVMTRSASCELEPDRRVQLVRGDLMEPYFAAAVAMYTEELGEDPRRTNPVGYRSYVQGLLDSGRAFGIVEDGVVLFKADVGAMRSAVAQIQGVWVAPHLRGRGIAAPAMAAVTNMIVGSGRIASLYVNDFNAPAVAAYRRAGYEQVDQFATVLY